MTELENPFAMPVLQRMLPLTGLGAGQFLVSILMDAKEALGPCLVIWTNHSLTRPSWQLYK